MASMEEQLRELTERVSGLEAALASQRRRQILRESLTCPSCANTEIFQIPQLKSHGGLPLRVSEKMSLFSFEIYGKVELYLCSKCGYGEVQMDPSQLQEKTPELIKVIKGASPAPESDPYR